MPPKVFIGDEMLTPEGGRARKLTNKTGFPSFTGALVKLDSAQADAVVYCPSDDTSPIGVMYEAGTADGSECWVVVEGRAQVLLKNATAVTQGNWAKVSDTAGRADITNAAPIAGQEARGIGHALESQAGGSDVLAFCLLQFN
jgi:hypothetical protein